MEGRQFVAAVSSCLQYQFSRSVFAIIFFLLLLNSNKAQAIKKNKQNYICFCELFDFSKFVFYCRKFIGEFHKKKKNTNKSHSVILIYRLITVNEMKNNQNSHSLQLPY